MDKNYTQSRRGWALLLVLMGLLLNGVPVQAQSGPVGNEWIVPGQQYYKMKIVRDGLYRINAQYLAQAGITTAVPNEIQIWRRGRQMATYLGGNRTTLDATTFLEFYAVHNDGKLDAELYKNAVDQPHQLYSFYTDTASYFITWTPGTAARHMQEPVTAGGTPHPHRLLDKLYLGANNFFPLIPSSDQLNWLPWVEPAEGFFLGGGGPTTTSQTTFTVDSASVSSATTGPAPRVEVLLFGGPNYAVGYGGIGVQHNTQVIVVPPTGTQRVLGMMSYTGLVRSRQTFQLLPSDFTSTGSITIKVLCQPGAAASDIFLISYLRFITPQANTWFANRNRVNFENDSLLGGPATYELSGVPATVVGFDVNDLYNVQRIASTTGTSTSLSRFVFPNANATATHRLLLANEATTVTPLPARRVRFRTINPAVPTFTIITHPQLMGPAGNAPNAALAYATYRASVAGGRYDTLMVTTQQLYDQFNYGDRSWLALRHFGRWIAAASPANSNRYLLLLGKGIVTHEPIPVGSTNFFARGGERGLDLVPTSSRAASDNLLTADYANNDFVAKLHTGRLTATTPQQVMNYLNKLIDHETLGPAPWRKNVLHLVGGNDAPQTAEFKQHLDAGKVRIERPFLGGKVTTEIRTSTLPVSVDISAQLNAGLSLITYFGHASSTVFALDFGMPSTAPNYTNTYRYPFLFLNGCSANATYTSGPTVVEDWLFADQRGALGSLAESGFGYPLQLEMSNDTIYKMLFNEPLWYGKPITAVHDEAVRRLQRDINFTNSIGIEQLLGCGWQGDPTLALFAPAQPDFIASNATLSVASANSAPLRADSPNFILNVGVANPAKITYDSVQIQVTRVFPAGSGRTNMTYPLITRRQGWGADTTYAITLPNTVGAVGTSTFRVVLDPNNRVSEASETNNTAQVDFSFLQGGVSIINPTEFAISPATQPRLVVQSNNPLGAQRTYDFEIDTVATFNRAVQRTTLTAGVVAEWRPVLPAILGQRDSLVWYWRARFHTPAADEDGSWVTSSFRVIPSSPGGWSQSHYTQLQRTTRTGVDLSAPTGRWAFADARIPLVMRTRGGGVPRSAPQFSTLLGVGIYLQSAQGAPSVGGCGVQSPNLLIAVYNPASLRPVAMPTTFQTCGQAPDYFYYFSASDVVYPAVLDTLDNLNYSATRQQQLDAFLTAIPAGSYVAVVSANRLRYSLLPTALKSKLQALVGSQLITQLADGEPLALLGQKLTATTGRLVHEVGPNRALAIPAFNQSVELRDTLRRPNTAGRIVSTRIGPARQWLNLYSTIKTLTPEGRHTLSVVAIDTLGAETVVMPNVTASAQPLASILATRYPYLRLELALADTVTRVPPQLRQWLVTSRGLPEGVVRRDSIAASFYAPATLVQQAAAGALNIPVAFKNVSDEVFTTPLTTRINLRDVNQSNRIVATSTVTSPAPLPGKTVVVPVHLDVIGKFGTFVTEVVVNPRLQPEQVYSNNELTLDPFTVIDNNVPPTLDVAFDGRHILNGELVSPAPVINIQLSDEDKLRHITDASYFTVTLLKPGATVPVVVNVNGSDMHFSVDNTNGSVARLTYEPGKTALLPDGVYTLRVQGRDPSNASAGSQDFQVKFEVVNASKITNVYPYPNPIISKARFVFTVTGQELPRNMKIQIMSLTGRVVREIFMSELGPLHIGNNITDFAWDGTDSFGDRLANGTYLYRVSLDDPSAQFGHRDTAGDKAFKNDWGKLVLMR